MYHTPFSHKNCISMPVKRIKQYRTIRSVCAAKPFWAKEKLSPFGHSLMSVFGRILVTNLKKKKIFGFPPIIVECSIIVLCIVISRRHFNDSIVESYYFLLMYECYKLGLLWISNVGFIAFALINLLKYYKKDRHVFHYNINN